MSQVVEKCPVWQIRNVEKSLKNPGSGSGLGRLPEFNQSFLVYI